MSKTIGFAARGRRSTVVGLGAVVIVLALSGFGGSSSPKMQVRHAYLQVKHAIVSGNAKRVCSLITKHAVKELQRLGHLRASTSCTATVKAVYPPSVRAKDRSARIVSITIHGNRAKVLDSTGSPPGTFIKQHGRWKVYSFV